MLEARGNCQEIGRYLQLDRSMQLKHSVILQGYFMNFTYCCFCVLDV